MVWDGRKRKINYRKTMTGFQTLVYGMHLGVEYGDVTIVTPDGMHPSMYHEVSEFHDFPAWPDEWDTNKAL